MHASGPLKVPYRSIESHPIRRSGRGSNPMSVLQSPWTRSQDHQRIVIASFPQLNHWQFQNEPAQDFRTLLRSDWFIRSGVAGLTSLWCAGDRVTFLIIGGLTSRARADPMENAVASSQDRAMSMIARRRLISLWYWIENWMKRYSLMVMMRRFRIVMKNVSLKCEKLYKMLYDKNLLENLCIA